MKLVYIIYLTLFLTILIGCNAPAHNPRISTNEIEILPIYYTPLGYEKCDDLVNNDDNFSQMIISYTNNLGSIKNTLTLTVGNTVSSNSLSSFDSFKGLLYKRNMGASPPTYVDLKHSFSQSQIQAIFDYILDGNNNSFFFNHDEYSGLSIPHEVLNNEAICDNEIVFFLAFFEPNSYDHVWAIFKCVDEYPSPGHPLYGLFEMLEDDFISQFESE